ncbi:unnamed protein product [Ranitomeya imitator]|uniref:Secreted protein n=1 Tax=Ranitomeya imitator TaxID=111125 RepID=A0ABN9M6U3_9NEOB|nr:unnamed protein product [Ranitomeya imitator]
MRDGEVHSVYLRPRHGLAVLLALSTMYQSGDHVQQYGQRERTEPSTVISSHGERGQDEQQGGHPEPCAGGVHQRLRPQGYNEGTPIGNNAAPLIRVCFHDILLEFLLRIGRCVQPQHPIRSVQMLQHSGGDFMKSHLHYAYKHAGVRPA